MAIDSNSNPRRLPFPLRNPSTNDTYAPEPEPEPIQQFLWQTVDDDEIVSVRLELSLNEYTALAAAIDVGRDIAFDGDREWIWQIWTKAFRGATTDMTCEDIADCIETSTDVQNALTNNNDQYGSADPDYLSEAGTTSTTIINNRFPPAERSQSPQSPPANCDLDQLWSGIKFMVDKLDERGKDWLEQIVAKVDKWERAAEFVGTVPIVGEISENLLKSVIDVIPDILEFYNAWSSEEHRQDMACTLFEIVCEECRYPTFDEILDAYVSPLDSEWQDWAALSLNAVMDYLFGSSLLASQGAWHTVQAFQLYIMYTQSTFFGLRGSKWIGIWMDNGEEFANDEWEVLCNACNNPVWCYEWDFSIDSRNWVLAASFPAVGSYSAGVGWLHTDNSVSGYTYRGVTIGSPIFPSAISNIVELQFVLDFEYGHFQVPSATTYKAWIFGSGQEMYSWSTVVVSGIEYQGTNVIVTVPFDPATTLSIAQLRLQLLSSNDNQPPQTASGSVTLKRIRVKGINTMPSFTGGQVC
jgi:hypothetical protein